MVIDMWHVIVRRIFSMIPLLIAMSMVVFLAMHLAPGDPAEIMGGPTASPEDIQNIRAKLGLDDPLHIQYWRYFKGVLQGDLGFSVQSQQAVSEAILVRLPNTIILSTSSILLAIIIGLPLGVISAVKQNTWIDNSSQVAALAGVSVPNFWLGIVFIIIFGVMLRWLPVGGLAENPLSWEGIRHLILPSFSLGAGTAALVARMTRSSVLEVIRKDYVRTARAKGVPDSKVLLVHTLRNALIPVLTIIGVSFGVLLGGAIITEQVFSINGIGRLLIQAISQRDFPMVQGCVLIIAAIFVTINLIVDILYTVVDPRISYQSGK
jgi:peptide/nickel transport system permease protein